VTRLAAGAGVLTRRVLNRTTLERQLLLERSGMPALEAVSHLVGVQTQEPDAPYLGLWTRLEGFSHDALTRLLEDRLVVRSSVLRGTQHLVTAADYPWLRPLVQPVLERIQRGTFGRRTAGMDLAALAAAGSPGSPYPPQQRDPLAARWPDPDSQALVWTAQALVPVIHPPPAGTWRRRGATPFTLAEEWLGRPLAAPAPARLFRHYLAAFGPASVADVQAWSRLTRLAEVAERLHGELRSFHDESGKELWDLRDAPLADPDVPAPVRFLPEFDNLLLGHADRTRVLSDEYRGLVVNGRAAVLVEGFVRAAWTITSLNALPAIVRGQHCTVGAISSTASSRRSVQGIWQGISARHGAETHGPDRRAGRIRPGTIAHYRIGPGQEFNPWPLCRDALARQYAAEVGVEPVPRRMNNGGLAARAGSFQTGLGNRGRSVNEGCGLTW
jgi:Winged helix DNA-binding domain